MKKTIEERIELIQEKIYNPSIKDIETRSYNFAVTSASLKKFLPKISINSHNKLYKDILYNQFLSGIEQEDINLLNKLQVQMSTEMSNSFYESPHIFATFHLGSYRILNSWLFSNGHNVVLIVDEDVYRTQKESMLNTISQLKRYSKNGTMDFKVLNVKDRESILQIRKYIRDGYSLVIYLDGNSGLKKKIDFEKGFMPIELMNKKINVKNGLDFISKFTRTPVIPVLSYRDNKVTHLKFFEKIHYSDVNITKKCYEHLEKFLIKYPSQWECWLYIHKWFDRSVLTGTKNLNKSTNTNLIFNSDTFIPFTRNDYFFLFNRENFTAFPIPEEHYKCFVDDKIVTENIEKYIELNVLL